MSKTNKTLNELKDFLLYNEGADISEVIRDILAEMPKIKGYSPDEVALSRDEYLDDLDSFSHDFWYEVMKNVANVIDSFKE